MKLRIAGTWDEAKRRLESLDRIGIDPTLSAQINHFDGLPEGPVLIVRVPQSFAVPHMLTLYTKDHLRPVPPLGRSKRRSLLFPPPIHALIRRD